MKSATWNLRFAIVALATALSVGGTTRAQTKGDRPDAEGKGMSDAQLAEAAKHVDPAALAAAVKTFHRILNATDVGITLVDYRRELLDTKTAFDDAVVSLPASPQRNELAAAMDDYRIAADVWEAGIQYDRDVALCRIRQPYGCMPPGIPTKTDLYRELKARYQLKQNPKFGISVRYDPLLKIIWQSASAHINRASEIQKANAPRN